MLKNKLFTIVLMLVLASPVIAEGYIEDDVILTPVQQEVQTESNIIQEELPVVDKIEYKQPVSKKKIVKKFLLAMGGVGISSLLLFFGLSLYNRVRETVINAAKDLSPQKETPLETPDSLTGAIKTFLDKTKW